jgi:protein-disulfide isomerase
MMSPGKIAALSMLLALAGAGSAAMPVPADPSCGAGSCQTGADDAAMAAVDQAAGEEAATVERAIDAPFGKAWLGAADGDVTLVVFADYACPACREAQPVIDQLIAADPRLKVVYRVLVNEDNGRDAAMTSLAVAQSAGADWAKFHHALDAAGDPTAATIAAALKQARIDPKSLPDLSPDAMVASPILTELNRNDQQIVERHGTAVPAWVLGDGKALNGFELAKLQAAIAAARAGPRPAGK